jgi:hypothetical protein
MYVCSFFIAISVPGFVTAILAKEAKSGILIKTFQKKKENALS